VEAPACHAVAPSNMAEAAVAASDVADQAVAAQVEFESKT